MIMFTKDGNGYLCIHMRIYACMYPIYAVSRYINITKPQSFYSDTICYFYSNKYMVPYSKYICYVYNYIYY
jgi:hypothetical protein